MATEPLPPEATETVGADPSADDRPQRVVVNVLDLRRRLGQRIDVPIDVELAPRTVIGSSTTSEPIVGSFVVESIERGVTATGGVTFGWEGECRRCLEATGGRTEIDIAEIFQIDAPEDSELITFDGELVDLLPIVRDAVVLSLPLAPLCREDCAGPDPDRYPAKTEQEIEAERAEERAANPDPRWAALSDLELDLDHDLSVDSADEADRN